MPLQVDSNNIGRSKSTPIKYELSDKIFECIIKEWEKKDVSYLDLFAGPGVYKDGDCLILRFLQKYIIKQRFKLPKLQVMAFEINYWNYRQLLGHVNQRLSHPLAQSLDINVNVYPVANKLISSLNFQHKFDNLLTCCDPNGIPDFIQLKRLFEKFPSMDLLLHANYVAMNRHIWDSDNRSSLDEHMLDLPCKHWYLSQKFFRNIIVYGSDNYYETLITAGFHHFQSKKGKEIFKSLRPQKQLKVNIDA